jgi:MFS family permease
MAEHRSASASAGASPAATPGPWSPFASRVFLVMWVAAVVGHIGTWMRDVGAGWLMTTMSASATAVALVQVATTLPIFLLSLPAGALADIVDRRRMLLVITLLMGGVSAALAAGTHLGLMTPALLVAGLAVAGVGTAMMTPVLQSLTPAMVQRPLLRQAIALNSMGTNVSRAIGPALGGLVVAGVGVAWTFVADAVSYLALVGALWWWKGASARSSAGAPESWGPAMRTGLRYALHAPDLQRVLLRAAAFFAFASAYWALLPLVARRQLQGDATLYGLLLTSVGAGAVVGALTLPMLRRHASGELVVRAGTFLTMVVLVVLALAQSQALAVVALALAGFAWIAVLTTANVAAQTQLPNWVRGRGVAVYLTTFYGAMAAGSLVWGRVADATSVPVALLAAAALGGVAFLLSFWKPLPEAEPDLTPSLHWPEPALSAQMAASLAADRGPVLVTVTYTVADASVPAFLQALNRLGQERLRDGAAHWGVYEDVEQTGCFVESFLLPSWQEHERQHARVSQADAEIQAQVRSYHLGIEPPRVWHGVAPARQQAPMELR